MTAIDLLYARRRRLSLNQSAQLEKFAFHGTSKANLRAIRAVGLLPMNGTNTTNDEGKDTEAKVCLALDPKLASEYAKKTGDGGVVLKIDLDDPQVSGVAPQKDKFTKGAVTVNRRIPPEAIKVVKAAETRALTRFRLADGYASDQKLKAQVREADWRPSADGLARDYGFIQDDQKDHGKLGRVTRYFHPSGDRLIVASRDNFDTSISQHANWQDRLKGVSGNWSTRWEYHSIDGAKSTGYDVFGLEDHLKRFHGVKSA